MPIGTKEFALRGGTSLVIQPDALDGFVNSPEVGVVCRARSKEYPVFGPGGEGVCRRILIEVRHRAAFSFYATPIVDGQLIASNRHFFNRTAPGNVDLGRASLLLPLAKFAPGNAYATGQRGSTFGVELEIPAPPASWHIEALTFEIIALVQSRARATTDS